MKKIFFAIIFSMIFSISVSANNYIENIFNWKKIKIFEYDISSENYIFKVWVNPDYNATSLRELMEKNNWVSAINWVFFCPADYKECWKMDFTKNERYVEWNKYFSEFSTWDRVVFAWDKENKPFLFQSWKINPGDEDKIFYWLANHPLILQSGESKISEYEELWLIASNMKTNWTRNFICSNEDKSKIYVWLVYEISLLDLPEFLKNFWCYDALNLDAWATTSMIYNGRQIVWPGRNLLDAVIIERKWFDTAKTLQFVEVLKTKVNEKLSSKNVEEKIEFLNTFISKFNQLKNEIYTTNSTYFYDLNWKKTWYKIKLEDQTDFENIFLINSITNALNELLSEAKVEKKKLEQNNDLLF